MQWYVGGEKLPPRPKASYADLVHLVTDWGHNIRQTEHLARVNENTSNIANSLNTLLEVNSFNLAVNSLSLANQEQSLANQEQIFQELLELNEKASSQLHMLADISYSNQLIFNELNVLKNTIQEHFKQEKKDRDSRLVLHWIKEKLNRILELENEFPEWCLLELIYIDELLNEFDLSLDKFSSSFDDLEYAKSVFDDFRGLIRRLSHANNLGD